VIGSKGTAVEWKSEGGSTKGSVVFSIGEDQGTLTVFWRSDGGGTFDYELSEGWELVGPVTEDDDCVIDLHFSPTTPCMIEGFAPSTHAFHFPNEFPEGQAVRTLDLGITEIPIGEASNGLCGGMTFAVRDYFEAGIAIPETPDAPAGEEDPLFTYLVDRLFASFDLPHLPATLMTLMNPAYPDHDGGLLSKLGADGRSRVMARKEFTKIREALDGGRLCPITLVKAKSVNPSDMGSCHQILIYGYQVDGTQLTLWAYDPNNPDNDELGIVLDVGRTDKDITVGATLEDLYPIYCFVVNNYQAATPPEAL
jgi:hypothetical protein